MLYIGHFSFDVRDPRAEIGEIERGSFTCLAEADSIDAAGEKFKDLIISLDDSFEGFESVGDVYLDDVIEVRKLPEEVVLARFEKVYSDGLGFISATLADVPDEYCVAYSTGPENLKDEDGYTPEPFIVHEE